MMYRRIQQVIATLVIAALVLTSVATVAGAAPVLQVRAQTVEGTIPGGQFAEIWLGLEVIDPGTVSILASWDRTNLDGIGFFILDDNNVANVTSGGRARDNNVAAGSSLESFRGSANQQEASIRATAENYTLVVFNESSSDASFTLDATNAYILDGSNNVTDPNAAEETDEEAADDEAADDAAADDGAADDGAADAAADDAAADDAATDDAVADDAVADEVAEEDDAAADAAVAEVTTAGVVRADEVEGELPNRDDIHYLGLEPEFKDGTITLSMTFDPQDSTELARRLNFWVLDERGFTQFLGGERLSEVAIAAGSSNVDTADNQRVASFKSVGFGPYTVLVSNTSDVPATYTLSAAGALLVDESGQTLTAQSSVQSVPAPDADEADADADETGTGDAADTTTGAAPTTPAAGREGEPGGTYTVQSGDTMYLIAQDIYGDGNVYQDICDYNSIANCDVIEVGDVLQLPTADDLGTGATAPSAASQATSPVATPTPAEEDEDVTATDAVTETETLTDTAAIDGSATVTDTVDSEADEEDVTADEEASGTLLDVLAADGRFKNLIAAVDAAGLTDTIADGGLTILAPTDAAFAALPSGALQELVAQLRSDPDGQLFQILQYHLAEGTLPSVDIEDGLEVQTLQGKTVRFDVDDDGNITVNGATVSGADIEAVDGIIHAIDAVILPPLD